MYYVHNYMYHRDYLPLEPTTITTTNIGPTFSIQVDTPAILPCQAVSDPNSMIRYLWMKDGQELMPDGRIQFVNLDSSGNLSFTDTEYNDNGIYQCVVRTVYRDMSAPTVRTMNITVDVTGNKMQHVICRPETITQIYTYLMDFSN